MKKSTKHRNVLEIRQDVNNKLAIFLKAKRKISKLTQVEMAEKSGVGIRSIREMERGKETLRMDKVNQVLRLFGMELGPVLMDRP